MKKSVIFILIILVLIFAESCGKSVSPVTQKEEITQTESTSTAASSNAETESNETSETKANTESDHSQTDITESIVLSTQNDTTAITDFNGSTEISETEKATQPESTAAPVTVPTDTEPPVISVSLEPSDGVKITSENPIKIKSGENAVFSVTFEDGYQFNSRDNLTYENGKLTVLSVLYPTTISGYCSAIQKFTVKLLSNYYVLGKQTYKCGVFEYGKGSLLTLTAEPKDSAVFLGFSKDRSFADGGEIVSFDKNASLTINEDITVYANYNLKTVGTNNNSSVQRVIYHLSGGKAFGSHDTFYAEYNDDYYYFPNSLPDLGYFRKDGYVLAGYTTKSGKFVGCGWNAETDGNNTAELYAYWLKETNTDDFRFAYDNETNGMKIKYYKGNEKNVVIPLTYKDKPVTVIGEGAFNGSDINTLMITKNIITVEDGTLCNCAEFKELIFSDGVLNISDGCMVNCPSFTTLKMNAVMMPRYCDNREGTYAIKYEHLRASKSQKKIVVIAGSNCAYGLDSNVLYDTLYPRYGYDIINYGCNKYAPTLFFLEACKPYFTGNDILLLCPEDSEYQFGLGKTVPYIWHFFEAAYEAFSEVDMKHFVNTFTSFSTFNNARMNMKPKTYQMKTKETTNRFGDYIAEKKGHTKSFDPFTVDSKVNLQTKNVTKNIDALNAALDSYTAMGVKVWLTHAVNNINSLKEESLPGNKVFMEFEKTVGESVHATVISKLEDYTMGPEWFYNSHQHLNSEGTAVRSQKLLEDILRQLEKK
ncbi:MAG: leucine-rich repeat protein [Clostridia bacterium]|nr:leucine-rich repeat protein [Clostridia bacterium]